jgi:hypothetical protein
VTSPADELRTAAEKIRALVEGATTGPWSVNSWGHVETGGFETVAEVWPLSAEPGANAAYIAAMHPGVGLALAAWLEAEAFQVSHNGRSVATHHALAVARAINSQEQP